MLKRLLFGCVLLASTPKDINAAMANKEQTTPQRKRGRVEKQNNPLDRAPKRPHRKLDPLLEIISTSPSDAEVLQRINPSLLTNPDAIITDKVLANTLLRCAIERELYTTALFLIVTHNADINSKNEYKKTPFDLAIENEAVEETSNKKLERFFSLLLETGKLNDEDLLLAKVKHPESSIISSLLNERKEEFLNALESNLLDMYGWPTVLSKMVADYAYGSQQ